MSNIEAKYFTTSDYNKFLSEIIDMILKQATLATINNLNTVSQDPTKNEEKNRKTKNIYLI